MMCLLFERELNKMPKTKCDVYRIYQKTKSDVYRIYHNVLTPGWRDV